MITPYITDRETGRELWLSQQCAEHANIGVRTWRSYCNRNLAPTQAGILPGGAGLWFADEVRQWEKTRPHSPGRPPKNG